jgi:hypothetical protein
LVVDHDAPAQIDFRHRRHIFEVEVFDVWPAAHGDEYNIGLELTESRL